MPTISILIGAYNAQNFIEECLDSIQAQTYFKTNPDYEILVGVDACIASLHVIRSIQHKYKNLRVFYAKQNQGVYITFNSLISRATGDHVLFFGADDTMFPNMVEECFKKGAPLVVRHHGIQFLHRSVFEKTGGFMPWRVAGDSEHLSRVKRLYGQQVTTCEYLYTYRKHPGQLTARTETGFGSELRTQYTQQINSGSIPDKIIPQYHKDFVEITSATSNQDIFGRRLIACGVASFPARAESLNDAICSIVNQVDIVFVYLNEYPFVPDYLFHPKIVVMQSQKLHGDMGDVGKFVGLKMFSGIYLTIDDDLVYSGEYVSHMLAALNENKGIVSLHGRAFRSLPCSSYYNADASFVSCLRPNKTTVRANIPGSGVMAFETSEFKPEVEHFETINMSDIWVGMFAQAKNIPVSIVAHNGKLVAESKKYNRDLSIWAICHSDDSVQTEIVNKFKWNI